MKTRLTIMLLMAFATGAYAQDGGHLNVRTTVQKAEVTMSDNGETETRLVTADTVVPGDDVVYTITFTNISDETAENVVITNPIASALTYIEGSAFGPGTLIEFSADGGETFAPRDELTVDSEDGQRPARVGDFTHVRWTMQDNLEAGAQGMAQFRARLN